MIKKTTVFIQGVCILIGVVFCYIFWQAKAWLSGYAICSFFVGLAAALGGDATTNPDPKSRWIFSRVAVVAFLPVLGLAMYGVLRAAMHGDWRGFIGLLMLTFALVGAMLGTLNKKKE